MKLIMLVVLVFSIPLTGQIRLRPVEQEVQAALEEFMVSKEHILVSPTEGWMSLLQCLPEERNYLLKVEWLPILEVQVLRTEIYVDYANQAWTLPMLELPFHDAFAYLHYLAKLPEQEQKLHTRITQLVMKELSPLQADLVLRMAIQYLTP